jgi:hypothetical protein
MSVRVPPPLTWHICCIIVDSFGLAMSTCILNQSRGHWLLSDALNFAISMSLGFRDEIDFATFDNLMEEDGNIVYELSCLASNIKKEVIQVMDSFLSFLKKNEKNKAHNMFSLMLEAKLNIFGLMSSFTDHEQGKAIVEKCDKKSLFPMLSKCYYHLHPLVESERGVVDQKVEEDMSLDIFEMITNTSESSTKLINRELLIFKRYQVDVKNIKCPM